MGYPGNLVPMCLSEHGWHMCVFCGWARKNIYLKSVFIFILFKCYIYISSKMSISLKNHILFFSATQVTKAYLTSTWLSPGESVTDIKIYDWVFTRALQCLTTPLPCLFQCYLFLITVLNKAFQNQATQTWNLPAKTKQKQPSPNPHVIFFLISVLKYYWVHQITYNRYMDF